MKKIESTSHESLEFNPSIDFTPEEMKTVEEFHLVFRNNADFFKSWGESLREKWEIPMNEKIQELTAIEDKEEYKQAVIEFVNSDFLNSFKHDRATPPEHDFDNRENWKEDANNEFGAKYLSVATPDIAKETPHYDFFGTMKGFAGHDSGSINTFTGGHDMASNYIHRTTPSEKLKNHPIFHDKNYFPELMKAAFDYPQAMQYLCQGLNTCLGYQNKVEEVDINTFIQEITRILQLRIFGSLYKYENSEKQLWEKVSISIGDIPQNMKFEGDVGGLFLTVYNIIKNFIAQPEKYLDSAWNEEPRNRRLSGVKKYATLEDQEAFARTMEMQQTLAHHAQYLEENGETFNAHVKVEKLGDNIAIIIQDNGLGFDLNALKKAAKELAKRDDLDNLVENGMLDPELKEHLELWNIKDSIFFNKITPHFEDLLTTARLSGSGLKLGGITSETGSSGLGLFAAKEMIKHGKGKLIIGENSDAKMGATFVILLPAAPNTDEQTTLNVAEAFRDDTQEVCNTRFEDIFEKKKAS